MSTPSGQSQTGVTWTVTSQSESTEIQPSGQAARGYRIYFQTGTGQQGSIFVPQDRYLPDNVRALLAAAAANADAIGNLSS